MFRLLYPGARAESVFTIDYRKLVQRGYKAIIFDIDNTLTLHGKDSTPQVDELFTQIHEIGLKTLLLSNNNEARILRFMRNIDTLYIDEAEKPKRAGYQKALQMLQAESHEVLCIGDQIFTDVLGANRCGIDSVLINYLRKPGEKLGKRRRAELVVLWFYERSKKHRQRLGNLEKEARCEENAV